MRHRDRHIALEGCLNFRDLGGYATRDGRVLRRGRLFRSGELCSLTDADLELVSGLSIRVVVDLRNEHERAAKPSRLPPGVELIERVSPATRTGPDKTLEEQIAAGEIPTKDDEYFSETYIRMLERFAPDFKCIVERAAGAAERPMLFHCAAGKDRTGMAAAVLLGLLGVPDETIVEDYDLTTTLYAVPRLEAIGGVLAEHGVSPDAVRHLLEARTPVLRRALAHVNAQWGGFDGYATSVLGVAPDVPERLRATLVQ